MVLVRLREKKVERVESLAGCWALKARECCSPRRRREAPYPRACSPQPLASGRA